MLVRDAGASQHQSIKASAAQYQQDLGNGLVTSFAFARRQVGLVDSAGTHSA